MSKVRNFFKRVFSKERDELDTASVQELRAAFTHRYHNFKLLLTANNKALEIMSDIEKALDGGQTFGMTFVKSSCTAVLVNVFRIIKHLEELAPGKYSLLFDRFKSIQESINKELLQKRISTGDRLVLPLRDVEITMSDQVGSKMGNVAEIKNAIGLPVPSGFVITALAYECFMGHKDLEAEVDRRMQATNTDDLDSLYNLSAGIQQLIIKADVPNDLADEILAAYKQVESETQPGIRVSLRSSALGEDAAGASFAGQFRSVLNVGPDHILEAYKEVVASKYGLPGITYRLSRGIPDDYVAMCVGCMAMVKAVAGGVMYSSNPLNIRDDHVFINSVWGLPKAVVDGGIDPDVYKISRTPLQIIDRNIKDKEVEFICYPDEGVCRTDLNEERRRVPSLTDEQALNLAEMAVSLESHYGGPQDIEWATAPDGSIYILQCRPLKQTEHICLQKTDHESRYGPIVVSGGIAASPGIAVGPTFIVRNDADKLRFPAGAILVAAQSLPRWAPLLGSCSAVITEHGGVAGHLANVAREFGIPAIFGMSDATEKLNDGEIVTVDADGLTIYEGRVEELLKRQTHKKNLMEGSPVLEILQRVSSRIIPLNLLDPDSLDFRPSKCETLHDLTRFSHEKSVAEMFSFGKNHHFSERSSKQLVCGVPMQWWIINLDDGYMQDNDGKFIHLEDIVSIPMLAMWDGVVSVPWEGPPPVDAGGFMSILMQATSNPALDPSMKSAYAARNYFMISKHFLSLASRFGFHFSTVEALVGERASQNYISFSFKGGAADYPRRVRRALFVGGLLEEYGFHVEIKKDSVFARLEGCQEAYMKERLKILGYLTMHTRQLDMVMSNDSSVATHRMKMIKDIDEIVLKKVDPKETCSGPVI